MSNFNTTQEESINKIDNIKKTIMISDMMKCIRKHAIESKCLSIFEDLLMDINDDKVVKAVVSDMNRMMEDFMILFEQIDLMDNTIIKSRMLTYDFIRPERFFKNTAKMIRYYADLTAAINMKLENKYENGARIWDLGKTNRLSVKPITLKTFEANDPKANEIVENRNINSYTQELEICRKVILLWNYCPAIVKAVIQTKRRSLGLDSNSTKF